MLKWTFKKVAMLFASLVVFYMGSEAQTQNGFTGNVSIKDSILLEAINGFYCYVTDKKDGKFNSSDYYVRINLSSTNDSTDYFEISLYSYAVTNLEKNPNRFYGYLKRNNIYFIFTTGNRLITKDLKRSNPRLFKVAKTSSARYPKPPYDPYRWEFIISKNKVIQKTPSAVIEKFVVLKQ